MNDKSVRINPPNKVIGARQQQSSAEIQSREDSGGCQHAGILTRTIDIVRLRATGVAEWADNQSAASYHVTSIPVGNHHSRRASVPPFLPQLSRCEGSPGRSPRPPSYVPIGIARRATPFRSAVATALRSGAVSDTWPPPGPQKPEPLLEHIHDVWVLHGIERNCVAGLYRTTIGIELGLHLGNDLIQSRLSQCGEAPLQLIAEDAKQHQLKQGCAELLLNATPQCPITRPKSEPLSDWMS